MAKSDLLLLQAVKIPILVFSGMIRIAFPAPIDQVSSFLLPHVFMLWHCLSLLPYPYRIGQLEQEFFIQMI
jgi:hypothetical protein